MNRKQLIASGVDAALLPARKRSAKLPTRNLNGERVPRLVLTLPWVPTANNAYPTSNGRRIKSREAKAYTETVRAIVTNAVGHVEGRLSVMIYCYAPDTRRYDVANREKIVCDALTACGVWADDSQIDELHIYRRAPKPHGAVCVCIQEIG